ncbi:hypothetical protein EJB05_09981, partial [Eragrostis curvula]
MASTAAAGPGGSSGPIDLHLLLGVMGVSLAPIRHAWPLRSNAVGDAMFVSSKHGPLKAQSPHSRSRPPTPRVRFPSHLYIEPAAAIFPLPTPPSATQPPPQEPQELQPRKEKSSRGDHEGQVEEEAHEEAEEEAPKDEAEIQVG